MTRTETKRIGKWGNGVMHVNGSIDEVMFFNRALSEEEIKSLYELDLR